MTELKLPERGELVVVRLHDNRTLQGVVQAVQETTSGIDIRVLSNSVLLNHIRPDQIEEILSRGQQ
jgi:hypothetical protein